MIARLIRIVRPGRGAYGSWPLDAGQFAWALGSLCALHRLPFDARLLASDTPPPITTDSLVRAARAVGLTIRAIPVDGERLARLTLPALVLIEPPGEAACPPAPAPQPAANDPAAPPPRLVLLTGVTDQRVQVFDAQASAPLEIPRADFAAQLQGVAWLVTRKAEQPDDPDAPRAATAPFGFAWFVPELLRHRTVWRDILLASFVIQILALFTPLFTQAIIDKVVVHRTESTLAVMAFGMAVFLVFSALLSWVRQYLVLHTGNRVDAVLAASVFAHLIELPPRYFEERPTGVIAARLAGVETIREFIAGAAVTLLLDLPFLLLFVAVMAWYSLPLTGIALTLLGLIALLSLLVAPLFQQRLDRQFLLGARNQAFLTEYIAGLETVKSLQMEGLLKSRYADMLAQTLAATFQTRQLANTYNTLAGGLEQAMSLLILAVGAYTVMQDSAFTIGMLVAFQMFAGKLSAPVMRLVGLWQQFQQARLSVRRLGDVMNAPREPYSLVPSRPAGGSGRIEIEGLAFRHAPDRPFLYRDLDLTLEPGQALAIMGPSGSGKSTLAKLLLGFYAPSEGSIRIDGVDSRHLSANALRQTFGVVPQETVLFSGSIYDNLLAANPHASFEDLVGAARMAGIHQAIEAMPQGYLSPIGERGSGLSGGQRQRLAIARALLKRPQVLLFDEATSALDQATAEQFAATVNQLRGKVTLIFITHALPKGLVVDEIVHLDGKGGEKMRPEANVQEAEEEKTE